ncbi:N-6 DNA methylase [Deinococcus sp. NW-56]|uniref:N-6 DNA methylase n=1 Tax=Deinococcus sp. NW-56 TaxID=2080419 RepID=UPI00131A24E7|nr:N-6 DNA methylase [Deinococcus sp. NW-56]
MPALETPLRKTLEKQVIAARDTAETAAEAALSRLLVDNSGGGNLAHLTEDERKLRKALLAKQKQLGSREALVRECAYEQWHAMLFARFLEASDLLMHPEAGASVNMDDLAELAQEEGDADAYATAARYAAHMLPGIFRPHDPLLRVRFAPEHRHRLEALIEGIPKPAFTADDALGWVYQFWQTARKQQVNASGRKIGGADISPVTQLFTEHYMVQFMLHNTVGAWWTARHPEEALPTDKSYLRVNEDGSPAAGTFPGWPATVRELKVLDPCCGSGHFLVAAFALLKRLRMLEEGLSEREAADAVLRDNLYGLELDPRCTQLAAFNLTLEAWKSGGYRKLPPLNIACSGLSIGASVEDWLPFAPDDTARNVFRVLHDEFRDAPDLGSLINPAAGIRQRLGIFGDQALDGLPDLIGTLLEREQAQDPAAAIYGENVQGITKASELLMESYDLVVTNVPFLGQLKQTEFLRDYISNFYSSARTDLSLAMMLRATSMVKPHGSVATVIPNDWFFQTKDREFRKELLKHYDLNLIAVLGGNSFETSIRKNVVICIGNTGISEKAFLIDVEDFAQQDKASALLIEPLSEIDLKKVKNSGDVISSVQTEIKTLIGDYADSLRGLSTGASNEFERYFWELKTVGGGWEPLQETCEGDYEYSGRSTIILWEGERGKLAQLAYSLKHLNHAVQSWRRGKPFWGSPGIAINRMANLYATLYTGDKFSGDVGIVRPKHPSHLIPLWCFLSSDSFKVAMRTINNKLDVEPRYIEKVPFDLPYWQQVAAEKYPDGLPEPYSNDPTQWLFRGTVTDTTEPLQVAMARLLGYAWPEQVEDGITPDTDGIVPLPALSGEKAAHERLLDVLAGVYGPDWTPEKLRELLSGVGADSLETWLRDKFFEQHAKLFHHRPFLWHIWDGRKDGFSAIVNYHTLDRARLEKLTYTYLGAWIDRQRGSDDRGAELRLAAALELQQKLEAILLGEPPYDIYVRWKDLGEQPRGWNPDLGDGVRLNIRPFVEAGILRARVNVKWGKDRGSDPGKVDFQKVHGRDPQTDLEKHQSNERHNDLHFTLREKEEAARTQGGVTA